MGSLSTQWPVMEFESGLIPWAAFLLIIIITMWISPSFNNPNKGLFDVHGAFDAFDALDELYVFSVLNALETVGVH